MSADTISKAADYMLKRSRECIEAGQLSFAKGFLLSAGIFVPTHLKYKHTSFYLFKIEENYEEASRYFVQLFANVKFCHSGTSNDATDEHREIFEREMSNLLFAIATDWQTFFLGAKFEKFFDNVEIADISFYRRLATHLKPAVLINCIDSFLGLHRAEQLLLIDLLLYLVVNHPSEARNQAGQLIQLLETLEQQADSDVEQRRVIIDHLKERYVTNILPALFSLENIDQTEVTTYYYKALKYFVNDYIIPPKELVDVVKREAMLTALIKSLVSIGGIEQSKKIQLDQKIELSLETLAILLPFEERFISKQNTNLTYLVALAGFLGALGHYGVLAGDYFLAERILSSNTTLEVKLTPKKRKLLSIDPAVIGENEKFVVSFKMLIKLNQFLVDNFTKDFHFFLAQVEHLEQQATWQQFQIEHLLYSGMYSEVIDRMSALQKVTPSYRDCLTMAVSQVQLMMVQAKQNELKSVAHLVTVIIDLLGSQLMGEQESLFNLLDKLDKGKGKLLYCSLKSLRAPGEGRPFRELIFLDHSATSILSVLIEACILTVKELVFPKPRNASRLDIGLGHLLVLAQYQWPFYYELYRKTLELLQHHSSTSRAIDTNENEVADLSIAQFHYPQFVRYVRLPEMLEDVLALSESGQVFMQLSETNEPMSSRGVTRHYKEMLRTILTEHMMLNSVNDLGVSTFFDFIKTELSVYFRERFNF